MTPITLTATDAATKAYNFVAAKPANAGKAPGELRTEARDLLTGMIRKGAFIIIN